MASAIMTMMRTPLYIDPLSFVLKAMMSVKSVNVSYSRNEGLLLPGLATDRKARYADSTARSKHRACPSFWAIRTPTWSAIAPGISRSMRQPRMAERQSVSEQTYQENYSANLNLRAQLEPFDDLKIDLEASRNESRNQQGFFRFDDAIGDWQFESPQDEGNFTTTILTADCLYPGR